MPFVSDDDTNFKGILPGVEPAESTYDPEFFSEVVPAAFRLENIFGSMWASNVPTRGSIDDDFDPFEFVRDGDEFLADQYAFANNIGDISKIQNQIDRERKDQATIEAAGAGAGFAATFAAGMVDPINFIPVGGTLYKTYRTGGSILRGAMTTARAGALGSTAQEAALQNTQLTRTYGESAANIGLSTLFGGILGSAAPTARAMFKAEGREFSDVLEQIDNDLTIPVGSGSAGARHVTDLDAATAKEIEDEVKALVADGKIEPGAEGAEVGKRIAAELLSREGLKKNLAVDATLKVVGRQDPTLRLIQSPSVVSRRHAQDLFEITATLGKSEVGDAVPVPVEALIRQYDGRLYRAIAEQEDSYVQYMKGRSKKFGDIVGLEARRLAGGVKNKLSYSQFREAVGRAARREDDATSLPGVPDDALPHINRAAKKYRSEIYDPIKDTAIELGRLPDDVDVKTAASYLNRVYDLDKLAHPRYRQRFIDVTSEWLTRRQGEAAERVKVAGKEIAALKLKVAAAKNTKGNTRAAAEAELELREKLHARDEKEVMALPGELVLLAEDILMRIKGTPVGRLPYDMDLVRVTGAAKGTGSAGAGALKKRVFNIPDELIEEFLINDVEIVARRYVRNIAPDLELTRKFGDPEMTKQMKEIQDDYQALSRQEGADTKKLDDQMAADLRDLSAVRDNLRAIRGLPDNPMDWKYRVGRSLRQLNYIRLLGGMTASAIPDLARPVSVHGFTRTFNDALIPLIKNFSEFGNLTKQLREDWGLANDMLMNTRMQRIADITDDFSRVSLPERAIGAASDAFGMVSLMAPWNTFFKQMTGAVTMARMIRAIDAEIAGKITKKERTYLRDNYIGAVEGRAIRKQLDAHGTVDKGATLPNGSEWTDAKAYSVFQAAMNRDVDRTIVTPGQDRPLTATGSEVGRHVFQFKSFAIAATQRILISGLQQRDMAALNGALFSVFLGMVSTAFKNWDAGNGEQMKDWSTSKWLAEGVDRSGLTGWLFEANNILERTTRGAVGVSAITGGHQMSRYASRNLAGTLMGPSSGTISGLATVIGSIAASTLGGEDWMASDTKAARRMWPYQNLVLLRQLFDKAESGVNSAIGAR